MELQKLYRPCSRHCFHQFMQNTLQMVNLKINFNSIFIDSVITVNFYTVLDEIATILEFCLEESTVIDVDIVEVLLTPLLPSSKTDNPTAFTVVERILRSLASHVEPSISKYINQILVGATIGESMDILDNIHFIIYELHKIAPELINRVIPNIATQLQSEEDLVR